MKEDVFANIEMSKVHYGRAKNAYKDNDFYECAFWCEQARELRLKALLLHRYDNVRHTHNLIDLANRIKLPKKYHQFLLYLMKAYLSVRYVTKRQIFYDKEKAREHLVKTREVDGMDRQTIQIVRPFARKLRKELNVEKVILFGSRANGEGEENSDFDFVVVGECFRSRMKNLLKAYNLWDYNFGIDIIELTPSQFEDEKDFGIVKVAVKNGIEI